MKHHNLQITSSFYAWQRRRTQESKR